MSDQQEALSADELLKLLYNDDRRLEEASALAHAAVRLAARPVLPRPLVLGTVA